jgi:YD repeat-containing protein
VSDSSGETTFLDYTGSNLTRLRTVSSDGKTLVRTRYTYDASGRLSQVVTDLSPSSASRRASASSSASSKSFIV